MGQRWGFLTNHALILVYVIRHRDSTVREIADGIGVTERATMTILRTLDDEGIVERGKNGRRNTYSVNFDRLAAYRREGTAPLTPREFVDGLIQTLLDMSNYHATAAQRGDQPERIDSGAQEPLMGSWGFFTNHALALLAIALDAEATVREVADGVGVTERAIVAILNQLEDDAIIRRHREGRRNTYEIDFECVRNFPRWSLGDWHVPDELVEVAVSGMRALAVGSRRPDGVSV